jgi:hypothetical protein
MAIVQKSFDTYVMSCYTAPLNQVIFDCYKGTTNVGRIVLYEGTNIPANANYPTSGPSLNFPMSSLEAITGMLRYEKPLSLYLNTDNLLGYIMTSGGEPVGEQEQITP